MKHVILLCLTYVLKDKWMEKAIRQNIHSVL
jgi:hypothetical protein